MLKGDFVLQKIQKKPKQKNALSIMFQGCEKLVIDFVLGRGWLHYFKSLLSAKTPFQILCQILFLKWNITCFCLLFCLPVIVAISTNTMISKTCFEWQLELSHVKIWDNIIKVNPIFSRIPVILHSAPHVQLKKLDFDSS